MRAMSSSARSLYSTASERTQLWTNAAAAACAAAFALSVAVVWRDEAIVFARIAYHIATANR